MMMNVVQVLCGMCIFLLVSIYYFLISLRYALKEGTCKFCQLYNDNKEIN